MSLIYIFSIPSEAIQTIITGHVSRLSIKKQEGKIKDLLLTNKNTLLKTIESLDEYKGSSIPKNYTSFCIQLIFQSNTKTLINKDIEEIIKNLQLILLSSMVRLTLFLVLM